MANTASPAVEAGSVWGRTLNPMDMVLPFGCDRSMGTVTEPHSHDGSSSHAVSAIEGLLVSSDARAERR